MCERKTDALIKNYFSEIDVEDYFCEGAVDCFFGKLIGLGAFTAVFNVQYPFYQAFDLKEDKDYVLMISSEHNKKDILSTVIKELDIVPLNTDKVKEEALQDWLDEEGFATLEEAEEEGLEFNWTEFVGEFNLYPFLDWIKKESDFDIFFVERVEGASELTRFVDEIDEAALLAKIYLNTDSEWSTIDQEEEVLEKYLERNLQDYDEDTDHELLRELVYAFVRDTLEVHGVFPGQLDLHGEQIVRYKGKYYCIDPFTY